MRISSSRLPWRIFVESIYEITKIGEPEVFIPVLQRVFLGNEMSKEIPKTSNASKARELFAANTDMTVESGSFVVGDAIGDLVARCLASMRS